MAADFANLQRDVEMINRSAADYIHVDIMDGRFVPNISFGLPVCAAVKRHATKPLDVHLMIVEPDKYLEDFRKAGADIITVHFETCPNLHRTLQRIKELGALASVAINPHTPVAFLSEVLGEVSQVLIMSVNPGFGGQSFIENTYRKVRELVELRADADVNFDIEVDGGVNGQNASLLIDAGVDVLVAGSFVFKSADPLAIINGLKNNSSS